MRRFGILFICAVSVQAGVIFSDLGPAGSVYTSGGQVVSGGAVAAPYTGEPYVGVAQAFTPASNVDVTQIDLALTYIFSTDASVSVQIAANQASFLLNGREIDTPGAVLDSWSNVAISEPSWACCDLTSLTGLDVGLNGGEQYWLVVLPGYADTLAAWQLSGTGTDTPFAQFGSGQWNAQDPNDLAFDVLTGVSSAPEPGSLVLLFAGTAVLVLMKRVRDKKIGELR